MPSATFPYSGFCHRVKSILVFSSIPTCTLSLWHHEHHKTSIIWLSDMIWMWQDEAKTKQTHNIHHEAAIATLKFLELFKEDHVVLFWDMFTFFCSFIYERLPIFAFIHLLARHPIHWSVHLSDVSVQSISPSIYCLVWDNFFKPQKCFFFYSSVQYASCNETYWSIDWSVCPSNGWFVHWSLESQKN